MATIATRDRSYVASRNPKIKTAKASDKNQVIATVASAFSSDPAGRYLYPNPHQFISHFPEFVRIFGGKAFEHGTAYYIDGFTGAALWYPPGVHPNEDALVSLLLRTVPETMQEEMFAVFEQQASYHPAEPHWYLPLIGVDPAHQGKGYGSALLQHVLVNCDRNGQVAYLESTSPQSVRLYERYGFKVLAEIQVGSSPSIFPMSRTPQLSN
jgi:ribosomal protein S18 acetylase RimI-like enzyme